MERRDVHPFRGEPEPVLQECEDHQCLWRRWCQIVKVQRSANQLAQMLLLLQLMRIALLGRRGVHLWRCRNREVDPSFQLQSTLFR